MSVRLRANCLHFGEVLAQSVAMIGPTITPVLIVPLMFAQAGNAGWLAYVFGALMLGTVALNVNVFARRSASAGSLYSFALRAFGPRGAMFVGWCLLWAYLFVAIAGVTGFAVFVPFLPAPPAIDLCAAIGWFISYRDVRLATMALLILEGISIVLIAFIVVLIFVHHSGAPFDLDQLRLKGATPSAIALGAVLAVFSMLGFESATSLGEEAKDPLRSIPRAVLASVVLTGAFFVATMYAEVLGARSLVTPLDKLTTPLDALTGSVGAPWMRIPIDVGALLCSLSICTAAMNAAARALCMMGRTHLLPRALERTHPVHETPHVALGAVAVAIALVGGAIVLAGRTPVELRRRNIVVSALAVLLLAVPAIGSVYPVPPPPGNVFPYLFAIYAIAGLILLWRRGARALTPLAAAEPTPV